MNGGECVNKGPEIRERERRAEVQWRRVCVISRDTTSKLRLAIVNQASRRGRKERRPNTHTAEDEKDTIDQSLQLYNATTSTVNKRTLRSQQGILVADYGSKGSYGYRSESKER